MWYIEMFEKLEKKKNEEQARKMSAYMRNNFSFLGVPKPKLNKIIKPYIKSAAKADTIDWGFVDLCWAKEYREAQYAAVIIYGLDGQP